MRFAKLTYLGCFGILALFYCCEPKKTDDKNITKKKINVDSSFQGLIKNLVKENKKKIVLLYNFINYINHCSICNLGDSILYTFFLIIFLNYSFIIFPLVFCLIYYLSLKPFFLNNLLYLNFIFNPLIYTISNNYYIRISFFIKARLNYL